MQATTTSRRFDPRKVKQATLVVGLLTSLAVGATTATIVRDSSESSSGAAVQSRTAPTVHEQGGYQFREQNLYLPTAGAIHATDDRFDYTFMEQNLFLPGGNSQPAVRSYDGIRFHEMNELPNSIAPAAPNWRALEMNSWGEGFDLTDGGLAPTGNDVPQQLAGEVAH